MQISGVRSRRGRIRVDMKKIIVYGVKNLELRRSIEYFLDDHYEIVGYTDGHYEYDVLDNQKFFRLEELCHQEFDFIVIASSSGATQSEIRRPILITTTAGKRVLFSECLIRHGEFGKKN